MAVFSSGCDLIDSSFFPENFQDYPGFETGQPGADELMKQSEKLAAQVRLERSFVDFEERYN